MAHAAPGALATSARALARPEDDFAGTVDEIVAHLEQDPVLVEEVMGNGHTDAIREALSAKVADSPVPVYVVLTKAPAGLTSDKTAEELLTLLHAKSGKDGVWVVGTSDSGWVEMAVYGDIDPRVADDETNVSEAVRTALEEVRDSTHDECSDCHPSSAAEAGLVVDVVSHGVPQEYGDNPVTDQQVASYVSSTWWEQETQASFADRAEMPTAGLNAMVATLAAVVVAVVAYRLLQAVGGRAHARIGGATNTRAGAGGAKPGERRRTDPAAELQRWKSRAGSEVRELATALERADDNDVRRRDVASACLERAEPRVKSDDLLEVVGAVVLARTGIFALENDPEQYRCCYVDPRHGAAETESPLGGGIRVPVCRACAKAMEQGSDLDPLTERAPLGGRRPYYEGSTVWATNGFGALGGDWWMQVPR